MSDIQIITTSELGILIEKLLALIRLYRIRMLNSKVE